MQNARMPTSANLIQIVTTALASATTRSGPHLVCKPGCYQCCIGVFPIAHQDAARLIEGLATLEQTDQEKAARIQARLPDSLTPLDPWFPADTATAIPNQAHEAPTLFYQC